MNKKRIAKGSGRDRLLEAATALFLEGGFESTSPQAIYDRSGVGQGSFYYHFKSKIALMDTVLANIKKSVDDEIEQIEALYVDPVARIKQYLARRQRGAKGCRLGRFVYENTAKNEQIAKHLLGYLASIRQFLQRNIKQAQAQQLITLALSAQALSDLIVIQVQGAYILSRIEQDDELMQKKMTDLNKLLFIGDNT
ncbi:MAG: TetR/AcrR family transcriptional repressor of nem operon [Candidatus Endobugula sp.]|jgi:TetR/AcrR family transcriptional repressor of nem operon